VSDGISFVLHAPVDAAYATALANEIGALPIKLDPGRADSLQFGSGVVCIVVWSEALAPQGDGLLGALTSGIVLVSRRNGVLSESWSSFDVIDAREPAADAAQLAEIAATHRVTAFDRSAQLQGGGSAASRQPFAARSAYGMAATLAVASLVTPFIMERAQATDATGIQPPTAPAQGAGLLRASLAALSAPAVEEAAVATPTPTLDRWLAPVEEAEVDSAPMLVAYTRDAAPLDATFASLPGSALADPKREAFHVEVESNGKPVEMVFQPLNSAKNL
jgi:hypothetical protein